VCTDIMLHTLAHTYRKPFYFKIGMHLLFNLRDQYANVVCCTVACASTACGQYGTVSYTSVIMVFLVSFEYYINSIVSYSVPFVVICITMVIRL
jgi:hypothetical protein